MIHAFVIGVNELNVVIKSIYVPSMQNYLCMTVDIIIIITEKDLLRIQA